MLEALKFVMGAVAKKDFLPAMTHFAIENGTVRSYNGMLALSSPLQCSLDCKPKAVTFVNAIAHCDSEIVLTLTPTGRLSIRSGTFKVLVDCVQELTPHVMPEGETVQLDGEKLVEGLKNIKDFIGDDASRPWATGVLLQDQSIYATNNVILVQQWIAAKFPMTVVIPRAAVLEMLRIKAHPTHAQLTETSITFHYSDSRWLRTQLITNGWPDVEALLSSPNNPGPVDERIFTALEKIKPFADKMGRVFIKQGIFSTVLDDTAEEGSARVEIDKLPIEGIYQIEMLASLQKVATHIDFTTYPRPCLFYGNMLRGAIIGMRP